ncbi:hypothetical protein SPAB_05776 [Salmonella enterica subsp. enterica serovar Paratyphi B str. SPB7]|uniref:Uncharacterized protein n=1 Tax=Salmonella paratyphi B (strain ATCC BAA-1250 / SPB7) TaxID=1016998 RepID=A0A6C6ZBM8_SALPB|nr:hypothetical protein SPAB_05776 [Salmonella enterica subsp. enterica serovar Paratyphi B str. SPB7]
MEDTNERKVQNAGGRRFTERNRRLPELLPAGAISG